MDHAPGGPKRKKPVPRCPNPLFMFWLTEWYEEAASRDLKTRFTYGKAMKTLKLYPLVLQTGKECKMLSHFGDKICQMLDKNLASHIKQFGSPEVIPDEVKLKLKLDEPPKPPKKRAKANAPSEPDPGDVHVAPGSPGLPAVTPGTPDTPGSNKTKRRRSSARYFPLPGSGPYALVLTLYKHVQTGSIEDYMLKQPLIEEAQALADKSFTVPLAGTQYTAWNSMSTLIKKGYVIKYSSPGRYHLTKLGQELAASLLEADTQGSRRKEPDLARDLDRGYSVGTSSPAKVVQPGVTPSHDVITDHQWSSQPASDGKIDLHYWYVTDKGKCTLHKDQAAVDIIDDFGIGFLVKCRRGDIITSSKRYKLDQSRSSKGIYLFAYIQDDDAIEVAVPPADNEKSTRGKSQTKAAPRQKAPPKHAPAPPKHAPAPPKHAPAPRVNSEGVNMTSHTITSSSTRVPRCETTVTNGMDDITDEPVVHIPTSTNRANPTQRTFPQVTTHTTQVTTPPTEGTLPTPEYTLHGGDFDIILCVDNHEHFGGSALSKKFLLPDLTKNGVMFDVRVLQVGDFLWIAKEKGGERRELVLDYIIERKRMDDLSGSIIDGRYAEQKSRMHDCGLRHGIYLFEEFGSSNQHFSIPEDSLTQSIVNTQIVDEFYVKRCKDGKDTLAYLTLMTRYLQSIYQMKTLHCCRRDDVISCRPENHHKSKQHYLINFKEFNESSVKTKVISVSEMFAKQLVQINGITLEKAAAITDVYPTIDSLLRAYDRCENVKTKETLLTSIKYGPLRRSLTLPFSRQISRYYNNG